MTALVLMATLAGQPVEVEVGRAGDLPPAWALYAANRLPRPVKEAIWERACRVPGLAFGDLELPDYDHFDGVLCVLYRRLAGDPLPYPQDPVLGWRSPQPFEEID